MHICVNISVEYILHTYESINIIYLHKISIQYIKVKI